MSGDLLLFPDVEGGGLSWARVGARGGKVTTGWAALGARAPAVGDVARATLLVPGEDVAEHVVALPARTDAQARAAAPFAVEDLVAQPLDDVHVVVGARADDGARAVAIVDRARFAAWRALLAETGFAPDRIVADHMAIPALPGELWVLDLGDRVLARGHAGVGGTGFAVDAALAREVLSAAVAQSDARLVRLWTDRADTLLAPEAFEGRETEVAPALDDDALARLFQRGLEEGSQVELVTADAPPRAGFAIDVRRWRLAAGLALAAGLGYAALLLVQIAALERSTDVAYAEAEELVRAAFPDIGRVVNPRAQLRARLGTQGDGGRAAFLALSGLVADSVRDIAAMEVDSIRFDAARAELDVAIRYAGYDDVERLSAAVDARNGVVEEGGSRRVGDQMVSDIMVRAQ